MSYNIVIVGATGIVGKEFLKLLENSNLPINTLKLFASKKSEGKKVTFKNATYYIQTPRVAEFKNIDFAIFAAGSHISKEFIPKLKNLKLYCIDLSSAYRMQKDVPLIIPEINPQDLSIETKLISSPNCTTTIMLMALFDLNKTLKIKRIIASTYQAASGGGKKLIDKLLLDTQNALGDKACEDSYGFNLFLHQSALNDEKYNEEEVKMIEETKKILNNDKIRLSATCVRVPVIRAHSIALNVEFENDFLLEDIYQILAKAKNIKIIEDYENCNFATPKFASGKNNVFISRIRKDISNPKTLDMWVCADQILKGAALNAFQILKTLNSLLEAK